MAALLGVFMSFCTGYRSYEALDESRILGCMKESSMGIFCIRWQFIYDFILLVITSIQFVLCECAFVISINVSILSVMLLRKIKMMYLIGE